MSNHLNQFAPFPRLPKEFRLKIWHHALQIFRIVEICQQLPSSLSLSDSEANDSPSPFYSPTALPPLLHTTHESRHTALHHLIPSFAHSLHPATIYFNPSLDTLFFPAWCFRNDVSALEDLIAPDDRANIRHVAIENLMWFTGGHGDRSVNGQIQVDAWMGLETFYLVGRDPRGGCGCCLEFEGAERGVVGFEGFGEGDEDEGGKYREIVKEDVRVVFEGIEAKDSMWKVPELKMVKLMRDGVWL